MERGFVIMVDEIYGYPVSGGRTPLAPFALPRYRNPVITVSSLSKQYTLTG